MITKESAQTLKPDRPPASGKPDCGKCERKECRNRDKYQRDRKDFSVTSGRCPRLPDVQGQYDPYFYDLADEDKAAVERILQILLRRGDSPREVAAALNVLEFP